MKTTLRLLLWSAAVVALMFGAAWLAERPGTRMEGSFGHLDRLPDFSVFPLTGMRRL